MLRERRDEDRALAELPDRHGEVERDGRLADSAFGCEDRNHARRRIAFGGVEAGITQDDHAPIKLLHEPLKGVIRDIGGGALPPHDQSPLIEQQQSPAWTADLDRHTVGHWARYASN